MADSEIYWSVKSGEYPSLIDTEPCEGNAFVLPYPTCMFWSTGETYPRMHYADDSTGISAFVSPYPSSMFISNGASYPRLESQADQSGDKTMVSPYPICLWRSDGSNYAHLCTEEADILGCFANATKLTKVVYRGTSSQWQAVSLGANWKTNAPFTDVTTS